MAKSKLMGIREFARHRGVAPTTVTQYLNAGTLENAVKMKGKRRMIDVDLADEILNERGAKSVTNASKEKSEDLAKGVKVSQSYAKARAIKEQFGAKQAQVKYEKMAGKLCRIVDVKKAAKETARLTRDRLLGIPDKIAPILASETDIHTIKEILIEEISDRLNSLSSIDWNQIMESPDDDQ